MMKCFVQLVIASSIFSLLIVPPVPAAAEVGNEASSEEEASSGVRGSFEQLETSRTNDPAMTRNSVFNLNDIEQPATTVKEWIAQIEATTVRVTDVSLNRTDTGLEIVLNTQDGKLLQVDASKFRTDGNSLITDIPNAVLALPEGQPFIRENPTSDIATVQVVQQDASNIRINVTGNNALPKTDVTLKTGEFAYSLNPEVDEPDEEIVVTGEQDGYRVPNASTATRTDTPLRDIPQSIQVIPQQVLKDQQVIQLRDAVRNVSGVIEGSNFGNSGDAFLIRGFQSNNILLDGIELGSVNLGTNSSFREIANTERVEVLKGPASVLYGTLEPGGIINVVTKQPLASPFYQAELQAGNFGLFRPSIDLSGPLNSDRTLLYRLNAVYQNADDFRNFDQGIELLYFTCAEVGDR